MKMAGVLQTMEGLESSRRVGWAKYYEVVERNQEILELLKELADGVIFHPRIHSEDKILDLARRCLMA